MDAKPPPQTTHPTETLLDDYARMLTERLTRILATIDWHDPARITHGTALKTLKPMKPH